MNYKQVVVYSCGDSNLLSTWSNVPFLFCQALEKQGVRVHRVNIEPLSWLNKFYNRISYAIFCRLLRLRSCPVYGRSWFHRYLTKRKIRRISRKYRDIDFHLFLTYAFRNEYSCKPSILWCDWSDAIVIERLGRKVAWYERLWINYETKVIQKADVVYSMFPVCAKHMSEMYSREICWLKRNVINTVEDSRIELDDIISGRIARCSILFIGGTLYTGACQQLIEAFRKLRKRFQEIELNIIGQVEESYGGDMRGIHFFGYLHKDVECEKNLYYSLLKQAHLFVNPSPQWGGYSSTVEAMYYGCPILISPYEDFTAEFGNEISFGDYLRGQPLDVAIEKLMQTSEEKYKEMCIMAHQAVKDYSWNQYVNFFLDDLRKRGIYA